MAPIDRPVFHGDSTIDVVTQARLLGDRRLRRGCDWPGTGPGRKLGQSRDTGCDVGAHALRRFTFAKRKAEGTVVSLQAAAKSLGPRPDSLLWAEWAYAIWTPRRSAESLRTSSFHSVMSSISSRGSSLSAIATSGAVMTLMMVAMSEVSSS